MGILIWAIKNQIPSKKESVFRYSKIIIWLFPVGFTIAVTIISLELFGIIKTGSEYNITHMVILILLGIFFLATWFYFLYGKIMLTDKSIIKTSIFGTKILPFDEIYKIVCHRSKGNPGAAMTKVYGKQKINLEAFLAGYDDLVDELRVRCKKAKFIEK